MKIASLLQIVSVRFLNKYSPNPSSDAICRADWWLLFGLSATENTPKEGSKLLLILRHLINQPKNVPDLSYSPSKQKKFLEHGIEIQTTAMFLTRVGIGPASVRPD